MKTVDKKNQIKAIENQQAQAKAYACNSKTNYYGDQVCVQTQAKKSEQ